MRNKLLITFGKVFSKFSQSINLGNGSTWPGHIALSANKHFIRDIIKQSNLKTIIVAGTNGKTTTAKLIRAALEENGQSIIQNQSGANLMNGIASTLLLSANAKGKIPKDFAIFEIDENALPLFLKEVTPDYLVLLNLFRDQLDRYGEVNAIVQKWQKSLTSLTPQTILILNADDPQIAYLGKKLKIKSPNKYISFPLRGEAIGSEAQARRDEGEVEKRQEQQSPSIFYFGLTLDESSQSSPDHAADSVYCPNCGEKLNFTSTTYSHLGIWHCPNCKLKHPTPHLSNFPYFPLTGRYNQYNTLAAALTLKQIGLSEKVIINAFKHFQPAFGRQEKINYKNKTVQLFLSKNPTSFNQSYETIKQISPHAAPSLLIVFNDRIPDGRDISWIWDTDLPGMHDFKQIFLAGDRVYDMAIRIKYELGLKEYTKSVKTFEDLKTAIDEAVAATCHDETLFILPTYSAMLEARKILTGKKIL